MKAHTSRGRNNDQQRCQRDMNTKHKSLIANVFMLVGIAPLVTSLAITSSILLFARGHQGQMGGSDAFLMIAMCAVSYALALLIALPGALWSSALATQSPASNSTFARALRVTVTASLALPLLGYGTMLLASQWR